MIFVGDDWAEDHHDVYLMDEAGARLASLRGTQLVVQSLCNLGLVGRGPL